MGREARARSSENGGSEYLYASLCSPAASPSEFAIAHEEAERVEAAMDSLPENDRMVLVPARVVGLSHREIAGQVGRTEKAVRSLLYRATLRLLAALEGRP